MGPWKKRFPLRRSVPAHRAKDEAESDRPEAENPASQSSIPLFPNGIKVLHDCENALVDVCFVHGLTGDRERTWTADEQQDPWPKVLLPSRLPQARILTFGYDAYVVRGSVASSNRLGDHASSLLNKLTSNRESCNATTRPLIFVAHSLGGIVCKRAILLSQNSAEDHLQDIFNATRGIVFLGTPHKGAWLAKWATIPASALGFVKSTNTNLLDVLQSKNEVLESIQDDFLTMTRRLRENDKGRLQITCFFEELPMRFAANIVEKDSASLEGYTAISIHANHRDMVKFMSAEDDGFVALLGELKRWVKQIGMAA
ncbi:Alpha/Beta hydrolase protein [Penicillium daleae]|uniref:Alpha/Beta hydrolase protein n=1 Tax=Penicillium daleae TaxID=63821 RepID=A0AAD6G1X4_9EURO|nr:Alpha/Beta hydrolase protein [Penicillium daleae]KAJ5449859.1 Alpha/Beta hydrolase protein [Penicillium daleae]